MTIVNGCADAHITVDYIKYNYLKSLVPDSIVKTLTINNTIDAAFNGLEIKPRCELAASVILRVVVSNMLHYEQFNSIPVNRDLFSNCCAIDRVVAIILADKLCADGAIIRYLIRMCIELVVSIEGTLYECPYCLRQSHTDGYVVCAGCGLSTMYIPVSIIVDGDVTRQQLLTHTEYIALHTVVERYYGKGVGDKDDSVLNALCKGLCKIQPPTSYERTIMVAHLDIDE